MHSEMSLADWRRGAESLNREFGGKRLLHCWALNGDQFNIRPAGVFACCSQTHDKDSPRLCSYTRPAIESGPYLRGLGDTIRANQTGDAPCGGCKYLVKTNIPKEFVSDVFRAVTLNDFWGCNSRCVYCPVEIEPDDEHRAMPKKTALFDHRQLFEGLLQDGRIDPEVTVVHWGGGEPTLLPTFEATVDFLSANGIYDRINTSGIRFSPAIERALAARNAAVQVSVDAGTEQTYRAVKQNPGFDSVWSSIGRYASTGGDLVAKYIIFSMNSAQAEVEAFIERCVDAAVRKVVISADFRSNFDSSQDMPELSERELAAAATMRNLAVENGIIPVLDSIWTPSQKRRIAEIGRFELEDAAVPEVHSIRWLFSAVARRLLRGQRTG